MLIGFLTQPLPCGRGHPDSHRASMSNTEIPEVPGYYHINCLPQSNGRWQLREATRVPGSQAGAGLHGPVASLEFAFGEEKDGSAHRWRGSGIFYNTWYSQMTAIGAD